MTKRKGEYRICPVCGKEYYVELWKIKKGRGLFCSKECKGKTERKGEFIPCSICGKVTYFKKYRINKNKTGKFYCSSECSHIGHRNGVMKTCLYCGNQFYTRPSELKKGLGKFCSEECRKHYFKNTDLRKKGEFAVCPICKKEFFVYESRKNQDGANYCSRKCSRIAQRTATTKKCLYCGKEILVIPSISKKGYGKYCSKECHGLATRGENSYVWKGGVSFNPYCEKFTKELREKVREKHNRVCFMCGKPESENGKRLSVHHVNYDKMQGCNSKWKLVPLCMECHGKTNHSRRLWHFLLSYKLAAMEAI